MSAAAETLVGTGRGKVRHARAKSHALVGLAGRQIPIGVPVRSQTEGSFYGNLRHAGPGKVATSTCTG